MKKILVILLSLLMLLSLVPAMAFAEEEVTIESIDFPDYYADECLTRFNVPSFTVNYSDGSSEVITQDIIWEEGYEFEWDLDFVYEPFSVGTYEKSATFNGFKTTFTLIVEEFPIESISVPDTSSVEHDIANGFWITYDDSEEPIDNPFFEYGILFYVTLNYKNGETRDVDVMDLYDLGYEWSTDFTMLQTEDTPFDIGEHTFTIKVGPLSTTGKFTVLEKPADPLPVMDRITYYAYADNGDDEDYCAYDMPLDLFKTSYNPKTKKLDITLKTEEDFVKEGRTKEEFFNLLTADGAIEDVSKWNYVISAQIEPPINKTNPLTIQTEDPEMYGMIFVKNFDDIEGYLDNPDSVEYITSWPYGEELATFKYTAKVKDNHVTYELVDECVYGHVWKAEKPIEEIINVELYYQNDPKSPETLAVDYSLYIAILSFVALVVCYVLYRRKENN